MNRPPVPSRWPVIGCLVLLPVIAGAALAPTTNQPQAQPAGHAPPDIVMLDALQDLYKPVPFDHKAHADMAMMWDGCETCHHSPPDVENETEAAAASTSGDRSDEHSASGKTDDAKAAGNGSASAPEANRGRAPGVSGRRAPLPEQIGEIPACKECHPLSPKEGTIRKPSLKAAYHRQCLNCHRDWSHENHCVICHEPASPNGKVQAPPTRDDIVGRMHPPIKPQAVMVYRSRFTPAAGDQVTFRHDEHIERFGLTCNECHHRDTCADCHHLEGEKAGPRKPLAPAGSWLASHGPCMGCHQNQQCNHCHYPDGADPPPSFEHTMTGQLLDDDHHQLACKVCHAPYGYHRPPYCGDAECHPKNPAIAFPEHRPGPVLDPVVPPTNPALVVQTPNVQPPGEPLPVLHARDEVAASMFDPYPTVAPRDPEELKLDPDRHPDAPESCIQSGCHEDRWAYSAVHGPVAAKDCAACHELVDREAHRFRLLREGSDLCAYCHQLDLETKPVLHEPLSTGQCLGCHNPHGGHDGQLLRDATVQETCRRCHWPVTEGRSVLHRPVAEGRCTACHPPHAARNEKLLDKVGADLCLACHLDFGGKIDTVLFRHQAMDEGCDKCHDVHGSNEPLALVAPLDRLCHECHEDVVEKARNAALKHPVVFEERACVTCHTPHGGDLASLMNDRATTVCLSCHDKPIDGAQGRMVADMSALGAPGLHKHGPLGEGSCGGCHTPHGGDYRKMLARQYSFALRQSFTAKHYALCLECHEDEAFALQHTETATGFRNGAVNLHFLHVTEGKLGRNCFACHNVHVSANRKGIRSKVQYGSWTFDLKFEATATGGRCETGCHIPFAYDRDKAVPTEYSTRPDKQTAENAVDADDKPITVDWKGTDRSGRQVNLPADDRSSLLVFMPADRQPIEDIIRFVRTATASSANTAVVLIDRDGRLATALRTGETNTPDTWQIVLDRDNALHRTLRIEGYPVYALVDLRGVVVSRATGNSPSVALKLKTHLQWLERPPDERGDRPPDLQPKLLSEPKVGKDTWYLQSARRHRDQGRLESARKSLENGLAAVPDSAALKTELAHLLIGCGEMDRAEQLIAELQNADADNPVYELLRCEVLVATGQWDQAVPRLNKLTDGPQAPAAYRLLGRAFEDQEQWQRAAEAYRKAEEARKSAR